MPAQRACFLELQSVIGIVFILVAKIRQIHRLIPKQLSILLKTSYPSCVGKLLFSISNYLFFMKDSLSLNNFAPKHEGICDNKLPFSITVFHRTNDLDGFLPCHPVSCIQHLFVAKTTYSLIKLRTTSRAGISMNRNLALKISKDTNEQETNNSSQSQSAEIHLDIRMYCGCFLGSSPYTDAPSPAENDVLLFLQNLLVDNES